VLTNARNAALYVNWVDFIESPQAREAFQYLVGIAATSTRFQCHIQWKGEVRDFRFHDDSGEQPLSFITNQQWLLFYFRPPAVRSGEYSRESIARDFDSFKVNTKGEWMVKLRSIDDVKRLSAHVRWTLGGKGRSKRDA
jgi:hypothetical protein